jgi:hypothetical protein
VRTDEFADIDGVDQNPPERPLLGFISWGSGSIHRLRIPTKSELFGFDGSTSDPLRLLDADFD